MREETGDNLEQAARRAFGPVTQLVEESRDARGRFLSAHAEAVYDRLTQKRSRFVRGRVRPAELAKHMIEKVPPDRIME